MNEESGFFGAGNVQFPLTTSNAKSLLEDADPAVFWIGKYLKAMLEHHAGARMAAAFAAAGLTKRDGSPAGIVGTLYGHDPIPNGTVFQGDFPLLGVFRTTSEQGKTGTVSEHVSTAHNAVLVSFIHVLYVLPPLTAAQANQLLPVLRIVETITLEKLWLGFDPNWEDGELVRVKAGCASIRFVGSEYGTTMPGPSQGEQRREEGARGRYPVIMMRLEIAEERTYSTATEANQPLEGVDIEVQADHENGAVTIAEIKVDYGD